MKTHILAAALAAALAPAPTTAAARAQTPESTLDRAIAAYAKVRTVQATFEQTLRNPLMNSTRRDTGVLVQQRPNYFSLRFGGAEGDRIVADGKSLWLYLPSSAPGQVIRTALEGGSQYAGPADITAQLLNAPRQKYAVADAGRATVAGRAAHAITLTARDRSLPFAKATVWVDDADALVRQLEVTDGNGVVRMVTITKLTVNAPVDRAQFTFDVPKGVRVVEQPD